MPVTYLDEQGNETAAAPAQATNNPVYLDEQGNETAAPAAPGFLASVGSDVLAAGKGLIQQAAAPAEHMYNAITSLAWIIHEVSSQNSKDALKG